MSLTVTNNGDGTVTISCGGESITIGAAQPSRGPGPIRMWPGVTPSRGGNVTFVAQKYAEVPGMHHALRGVDELAQVVHSPAVEAMVARRGEPVVIQFDWKARQSLDLEDVRKAMRGIEDAAGVYCSIDVFPLDE